MSIKVLFVEDDKIDQMAFKRLVQNKQLDYDYTIAQSVAQAREILNSAKQFDIVILDYNLADGTAFDIFDTIANTPIVFAAGKGSEEIAIKAMKAGAYDYLIKDLDRHYLTVLPITVEKAIKHHRSMAQFRILSHALMNINDSVYITDPKGKIILVNKSFCQTYGYEEKEILGQHNRILWKEEVIDNGLKNFLANLPEDGYKGEFYHQRQDGREFPVSLSQSIIRDDNKNVIAITGVVRDITERKQAEEVLQQHNHKLALLNRASQAFVSTLDLDRVLSIILEGARQVLDVVACSAWLVDPETNELICQQITGPKSDIVRGWRLAPGAGLVGWVARTGKSLIVPDTQLDGRHFKEVDQQTELNLRSILSVPLRVKETVIGVLQAVDAEVDHFSETDLTLMKSLGATAAIAIENARLYQQSRQDAETKAMLLHEVNHRVKNNLTTIIGLLYVERRHSGLEDQATYQIIIKDLISRIQGLATVHDLLSASKWSNLLLSDLAAQIIHTALKSLPSNKHVSVKVPPTPIRVTPKQASNLTLIINELAINSVKYALSEQDTGNITIHIALENETILFEFRDDGPGYPEEVLQLKRHNVGMYLIQRIVLKDLYGELTLHNDHGAVTLIRFKTQNPGQKGA